MRRQVYSFLAHADQNGGNFMSDFYPDQLGALADGVHDDQPAIQRAIDLCAESGGGRVTLTAGKRYYSASLQLRTNVELHLERGCVLQATSVLEHYIRPSELLNTPENMKNGNPMTGKPAFAFIYAKDADNCAITGDGTIDGNGYAFVSRASEYYVTGDFYPRPTAIYVEHSDHITFRDFTVRNVPFWTLHPAGCNDVLIEHIRILNDLDVANSDGIDPDHCTNVRILGCHIEAADDCIVLKNTEGNREYGPCRNIVVSGCTLKSTSGAFKIGTEGIDNFENIVVSDCIITGTNRGITMQIRDNGNVKNALFQNIIIETRRFCPDFWGSAEPIAITSFDRDENTCSGTISNVRFSNIVCHGENGALIYGGDASKIQNITFENCDICLEKTSKWPCGIYDLRPGLNDGLIEEKNACVYVRNAGTVTLRYCRLHWAVGAPDCYSYAVDAKNADLIMEACQAEAADKSLDACRIVR